MPHPHSELPPSGNALAGLDGSSLSARNAPLVAGPRPDATGDAAAGDGTADQEGAVVDFNTYLVEVRTAHSAARTACTDANSATPRPPPLLMAARCR